MIVINPDAPLDEVKAPPLPPKDVNGPQVQEMPAPPPPYAPLPEPASPQPEAGPSHLPPTPTTQSIFNPQVPQTVNHFELFASNSAISGSYLVDPLLPSPMAGMSKNLTCKRNSLWGKEKVKIDLNAFFKGYNGAINLDLAVIAQYVDPATRPLSVVPTRIAVSSRNGRVNVNVREVQPGRSLDLAVESSNGKVVVFLPPTFDGPIILSASHSRTINLLPALAARTRIIRASDSQTILLAAPPGSQTLVKPTTFQEMVDGDGDRCLVRTHHGKVFVGISGLDRVEEPLPTEGFFSSLGKLFETQGRAMGKYFETQARLIEMSLGGTGSSPQQDTQSGQSMSGAQGTPQVVANGSNNPYTRSDAPTESHRA